jgi:sulfide:quinone oxidoreductase
MGRLHVVVLGGGFGGIVAAYRLRERLGEAVEITLIDRRTTFMMGLRILWTIDGRSGRAAGTRSLDALTQKGIRYLQAAVNGLDPLRKRADTSAGTISGDVLLVALGAELRPDLVPGYVPEGSNLYDPEQSERIAARVAAFERGRIAVGIMGVPYKCPPAPYEAALLIDGLLRRRGVRDRVEIDVFTPQPASLPVAGPEMCMLVERMLADRDIQFLPNRRITAVEGSEVVFERERRGYDLLIGIPPHRAPAVVRAGGLTVGEWVRPDRRTCEIPESFNVFAVGDVTEMPLANGMMLPKAGVFAEAQGYAAADAIIERFGPAGAGGVFDGRGACFFETGGGRATAVEGEFFAEPAPAVRIAEPSERGLAAKRDFEATRLAAWF